MLFFIIHGTVLNLWFKIQLTRQQIQHQTTNRITALFASLCMLTFDSLNRFVMLTHCNALYGGEEGVYATGWLLLHQTLTPTKQIRSALKAFVGTRVSISDGCYI